MKARAARAYYVISGLFTFSASFIWSVNTLFLLAAGLDLAETFLANAIFTAAMSACEIPTGVFADSKGRRFSFLMSAALLCLGTSGYVVAYWLRGSLLLFGLMSAILGCGFAFYSGAVEAWVVDELKAEGYSGGLDPIFARAQGISGFAMLAGTLAGGFLGQIDLALPYLARIAALLGLFVFASSAMRETGFSPPQGRASSYLQRLSGLATRSIAYGWKKSAIRLLMISGIFQSAFGIWGFYAAQPYLLGKLGQSQAIWVAGICTAGMALAQVAGNLTVRRALLRMRSRILLLALAGSGAALACLLIGLSRTFPAALASFMALMFFQGLSGPVRQAYLNAWIPGEQRATVLSFDSLLGNGAAIVGQSGLGLLARASSLGAAYLAGAGLLAASVPCTAWLARQGPEPAEAQDAP